MATLTAPVVATFGTVAVILLSLHETILAGLPLNITWLLPSRLAVKPDPPITTVPPCAPAGGDKLAIVGLGTENTCVLLLATAFTLTITGPVLVPAAAVATMCVSLQLTTLACTPWIEIVLSRCVA